MVYVEQAMAEMMMLKATTCDLLGICLNRQVPVAGGGYHIEVVGTTDI